MLYEQLGGSTVIRATVTVLYQRIVADPDLAPWFAGIDLGRLRAHQHAFLAAALDGPALYTGRELAEAHAGRAITGEAFDRLCEHLAASLRDLGVEPAAVSAVVERIEALRPAVVD
ncbi:group 1 truncated hemoglobin [Dactylosporangium sp. NPDC000244]|uniref:group I truncated hemoglobin n=1 Tax=Dactylosporangium sp. NPDC000244 TaxID=3154365 RepID=UPI00331B55E7|nr:group 1 truncated hemoglobin [Dactylosporangium thailandense]